MNRSMQRARVGLFLVLLASGCSETKKASDVPDAAARRVLFQNLAERVIAPTYAEFTKVTGELSTACASYAKSQSPDDLKGAQAAFVKAMLVWERAEVFQVGPSATQSDATPGGQGLRQEIYAWNTVSQCGISRALVAKTYGTEASLAALYPDARGLGALEILLFDASDDSGCAKTNDVITSGDWDKLVAGDIAKRRSDYAAAAAKDLVSRAKTLEQAFKDFIPELSKAGDGGKLFDVTQDALNAISDALFYVDTETKDMKLAIPLGLTEKCTGAACLTTVEHPYAKISARSIQANLEAFRDLFRGLPPKSRGDAMWGLKDLLLSVSADALASDMDKLLDASIAAIGKVESLEVALEKGEPEPMQAYMQIQSLTDRLKTDFIAVLSLRPPMNAAGDND